MKPDRDVEEQPRKDPGTAATTSDTSGETGGEQDTAQDATQAWIERLRDPNTPLTEVMGALRQAALLGGADAELDPELEAVATARLEQAWREGIERLRDPNTPLTEVLGAARQAQLLGREDPELDAVVTARLEQAWRDQIERLRDPNTPLTEVMATLRQAQLLGGADAELDPELEAIATARLGQAWQGQITTVGVAGNVAPQTTTPTSEPGSGGGSDAPQSGGRPDWGSGSGWSGAGAGTAPSGEDDTAEEIFGGGDDADVPPDIVDDASVEIFGGGDDADVPPDIVDPGSSTAGSGTGGGRSTSGSHSGGGTVVGVDEEAEFVEIRPGTLGYIWVENEDGTYTAYDPNTGAPVDTSESEGGGDATTGDTGSEEGDSEDAGDESDEGDEEAGGEEEGDSGASLTEDDPGAAAAMWDRLNAVNQRVGLGPVDGGTGGIRPPGYVDPVDPDLALATDSGRLSVVRPGDPHVNPDLVSLYGPDGGADGGVTVSTSGTPPVLGYADPPKPMPGGEDPVPGGPLTPGTGWGGGGGYDPTIAGGADDDLDDLEVQRLTGGGPSTPTQSLATETIGGDMASPQLAAPDALSTFSGTLTEPGPLLPDTPPPGVGEGSLPAPDEAGGLLEG